MDHSTPGGVVLPSGIKHVKKHSFKEDPWQAGDAVRPVLDANALAGASGLSLPEAAEFYATEFGWPLFPVNGTRLGGACACEKGLDCPDAGKHPLGRLAPRGLKNATDDISIIRAWWAGEPTANIGLPTGRRSGVFVVDVDYGKGGFETLALLIQKHGAEWLEGVPWVRTGGGGAHLYFRCPLDKELPNTTGKIGPGVDTRGEGGYVLLPPSVHTSSTLYDWTV